MKRRQLKLASTSTDICTRRWQRFSLLILLNFFSPIKLWGQKSESFPLQTTCFIHLKNGKNSFHGLRLWDSWDSPDSETPKTLRLRDSGTLFVYLASIFVLTLLLPGHVLEGNEIHISDFFVEMNYSISLLDLYLNASLRVF